MTAHVNGSGQGGGRPGNVASLDEARRRAAEKAKAERRAASLAPDGPMSLRDGIVGLVLIALALAMVWHWVSPLVMPAAEPAGVVR